jgi:hypothetical protein
LVLGRLLGVLLEIVCGCNVNRGYLWRAWELCESYSWRKKGEYIGSSLAYLIVKGSENREYWT